MTALIDPSEAHSSRKAPCRCPSGRASRCRSLPGGTRRQSRARRPAIRDVPNAWSAFSPSRDNNSPGSRAQNTQKASWIGVRSRFEVKTLITGSKWVSRLLFWTHTDRTRIQRRVTIFNSEHGVRMSPVQSIVSASWIRCAARRWVVMASRTSRRRTWLDSQRTAEMGGTRPDSRYRD